MSSFQRGLFKRGGRAGFHGGNVRRLLVFHGGKVSGGREGGGRAAGWMNGEVRAGARE